jgi:hypothetical protein
MNTRDSSLLTVRILAVRGARLWSATVLIWAHQAIGTVLIEAPLKLLLLLPTLFGFVPVLLSLIRGVALLLLCRLPLHGLLERLEVALIGSEGETSANQDAKEKPKCDTKSPNHCDSFFVDHDFHSSSVVCL